MGIEKHKLTFTNCEIKVTIKCFTFNFVMEKKQEMQDVKSQFAELQDVNLKLQDNSEFIGL